MLQTILDLRLDWVAFSLASLVGMTALLVWLRRRGATDNSPIIIQGLLVLAIVGSGIGSELAGNRERARLRGMLQGIAPTYAIELNRLGYSQLSLATQPDDPKYLELIETQKLWLEANPAAHDIYTFHRRSDGTICLLLDSETDYDRNGRYDGEREQRTAIGEVYEADDRLQRAFAGEQVFDAAPATDRWGTWVSAYSPMFDSAGRVIAVLGVDYAADGWSTAILLARGIVISSAAIAVVALLASLAVISLVRRELQLQNDVARSLRESEARLRALVLYDRLTNLPNRALLNDRVSQAILRARRRSTYRFALLFIDLDGFKKVNDKHGHAAGDLLLKAAAERFRVALRETDTICRQGPNVETERFGAIAARLGGDEFVIMLDDIVGDSDVIPVVKRILAMLNEPCTVNGEKLALSASIGVACSHPRYRTVEQMLRDADVAMYHAKVCNKGGFAIFNPEMQQQAMERIVATNELRDAIDNNQFVMEFQPIVSLEDRSVTGFEALMRWNHPTRGRIAPDDFIGLAEETGLIVPLGNWALREVARTVVRWRPSLPANHRIAVSVNISRRQLESPTLATEIQQILSETGARAGELKLEITESLIAHDPEAATQSLGALKQMGLGLVVDDFGLGSSSLGLLHRFPVEGMKVDRSFMAHVSQQRDYAAVVQTIVDLARNLKLTLVAEGVETPEQAAMLQAMGCTLAQGYLFSRPLSDEAALEYASALPAQSVA